MGCLCSKPESEKCSNSCCDFLKQICCCRCCGWESGSSSVLITSDPFADAKNSKLAIRRISRVVSEESAEETDEVDTKSISSSSQTGSSSKKRKKKFIKKRSIRKKAFKYKIKGNKYNSSLDHYSEEGSLDEGKYHKKKKSYWKTSPSASDASCGKSYEKEPHIASKWVDIIKGTKRDYRKKQKLGAFSASEQVLAAPQYASEETEKKKFRTATRMNVDYGSLLNIPTFTDYKRAFSVSDNDIFRSKGQSVTGSSECISRGSSEFAFELQEPDESKSEEGGEDPGSMKNPYKECYGSITFTARYISSKVITVSIRSLQGLPCQIGKDSELSLEISAVPGGKPTWFTLPPIRTSSVRVNSDVILRLSSTAPFLYKTPKHDVHMTLWSMANVWKHSSYGTCLLTVGQSSDLMSVGLYRHSNDTESAGSLEISLETKPHPSSSSKTLLYLEILRAILRPELAAKFTNKRRDIWCRVSVWCKGKRVHKITTRKIYIPISYEPSFKSRTEFQLQRSSLPNTTLVIKVMSYRDIGLNEVVIGKLILGPHTYLGTFKDEKEPGTLTHWGKAITHLGPKIAWHSLYL